jgi:hypothetical protein
MFDNYNLVFDTNKISRGDDNWYKLCGLVIRKISTGDSVIPGNTEQERLEFLEDLLVEHIVDSLMMDDKIMVLNYIYTNNDILESDEIKMLPNSQRFIRFYSKMQEYIQTKIIVSKGITGIIIFNGPSRIENLNIFVLDNQIWIPAKPEDKRDLQKAILNKYSIKTNLNLYVGFIGFETNKKYMVYKVKDTNNMRSTGFRCDQAGKEKIIKLLNQIEVDDSVSNKNSGKELCVRQELILRSFQKLGLDNKTWFLDTETAIINEFEKKEKKTKK